MLQPPIKILSPNIFFTITLSISKFINFSSRALCNSILFSRMSNSMCSTPLTSFKPISTPSGLISGNCSAPRVILFNTSTNKSSRIAQFQVLQVKAAESSNPNTQSIPGIQGNKINSLICSSCEGNGAKVCHMCEGEGVNSKDHFNGQFKAGGLCWLCRGKREILCGECNGAGFKGGFMSTADS